MRAVLMIVCLLGLGMVMVAFTMAFEGTGARTAAVVDDYIERTAAEYEANGGENRAERRWGRLMRSITSMNNGILRSAPVDLPAAMPAAPEGWAMIDYETAHGAAITGFEVRQTNLATSSTNAALLDFERADGRHLSARATYVRGETLAALRMTADMDRIREIEAMRDANEILTARPVRGVIAAMHGVPVVEAPRYDHNPITDTRTRVEFGRYTMALDGMVEIELLTNGSTEDALAVLAGLDLDAIRAALPDTSDLYAARH